MKNITKIFAASAAVLLFMVAAPAFANTSINTNGLDDSFGYHTLGTSNVSDCNNCTNWAPTVSADAGETVAFIIYYHNSGTETANNMRVTITPSSTSAGTAHSFTATVSADNANSATGSATVNLSSSQVMNFDSSFVRWCKTDGQYDCMTTTGTSIVNGGFSLGSVLPDSTCAANALGGSFCHQGTIVVHFNVGNTIVPPPSNIYQCSDFQDNDLDGYTDYPNDPDCTSSTDFENVYNGQQNYNTVPSVTTNPATNITTSSAVLNGYVNTNNYNGSYQPVTSCWFTWGSYYNSMNQTQYTSCSITSSGYFSTSLYGLTANTSYSYQACASNSAGQSCGGTQTFFTTGNTYIPQANVSAVTLTPTGITQSSAQLNGIATQTGGNSMTAWFEYGSTIGFGSQTSVQSLGSTSSTNYFTTISGLSSNVFYYYRAVVQSATGQIAYGQTQTFRTLSAVSAPAPVVIVSGTGSGSSLVQLDIKNLFGSVCIGSTIEYNVHYKNISGRSLSDTVLTVALPQDAVFLDSTRGEYSTSDHTVVVKLGTLDVNEEDTFIVRATIKSTTLDRDQMVAAATLAFTHPVTKAQDSAIAYDLSTANRLCQNSLLGLALFGGDFFPHTLLGWLIIILVLIAIYYIARRVYMNRRFVTSTTTMSNNVPPSLPRY